MKTTCIQSIVAIVLKELRLERGLEPAQIADFINKTSSAVAKIEMGRMTLSLESLYAISFAYGIPGSQVLFAAEHYAQLLATTNDWYISRNRPEVDDLVSAASMYYKSTEFQNRQIRVNNHGSTSILYVPQPVMSVMYQPPEVFQFILGVKHWAKAC